MAQESPQLWIMELRPLMAEITLQYPRPEPASPAHQAKTLQERERRQQMVATARKAFQGHTEFDKALAQDIMKLLEDYAALPIKM